MNDKDLNKQVIITTFNIFRKLNALNKSSMESGELSILQIRVLLLISESSEIMMTDIAKYLAVTPAAMTQQINFLVETGWVERIQNKKDRRVINIRMTKKAKRKYKKILKKKGYQFRWLLDSLDRAKRKILLDILRCIDNSIENKYMEPDAS